MEFIGRERELQALRNWDRSGSRLTVVYGRRRVGKTRLIQEAGRNTVFYKFEGLEGKNTKSQKREFQRQIMEHFPVPEFLNRAERDWPELLIMLSRALKKKRAVVLFDEFQWMCANRTGLVSYLKYVWDNHFLENNRIHLILCGSISSFMKKKVMNSKALYGRIDQEIHLHPLPVSDIVNVIYPRRSLHEILQYYFVIGGIPKYWELVDTSKSFMLNIQDMCFNPLGYLYKEFGRIFISHFGKNPYYKRIVITLSQSRWADSDLLEEKCALKSGGRMSEYLEDLESAGFIEKYYSVEKPGKMRYARFRISDPYFQFYFNFIVKNEKSIASAKPLNIHQLLPDKLFNPWQGLAFERFCLRHNHLIAKALGFSGIIYEAGPVFPSKNVHSQIDLIFYRADNVITLCEVKFKERPVGVEIVKEVEAKVGAVPNPKQKTIEKVLVSAGPVSKALRNEGYFYRILSLDDILR